MEWIVKTIIGSLCRIKIMKDSLQKDLPETGDAVTDQTPDLKPEPLGWKFFVALALVGILVLEIIFVNMPGIQASAVISLTSTNWTLQSYGNSTGDLLLVIPGTTVTAVFDRNGTVTGSGGCNRYRAPYSVRDFAISISLPSSTKILCNGTGVMEQESDYFTNLPKVVQFRINKTELVLYDKSGNPVLVYVKE
jgi:heat shock protein HslJ